MTINLNSKQVKFFLKIARAFTIIICVRLSFCLILIFWIFYVNLTSKRPFGVIMYIDGGLKGNSLGNTNLP